MTMYVVGKTNNREAWVVNLNASLKEREYLVFEDVLNGNLLGEVVENIGYSTIADTDFSKEIMRLYNANSESKRVFLARVSLLREIDDVITPNTVVRKPTFDEIKPLFFKNNSLKNDLLLGAIRGAEGLEAILPAEYQNLCKLRDLNGISHDQKGLPFLFPIAKMKEYPHIGLFGGTGSGKTHGLRVMLEELLKGRYPVLAFDPHLELEFSKPSDSYKMTDVAALKENQIHLEVGRDVGIDFTELTSEEIASLLEFSGEMTQPMRQAVIALHEEKEGLIRFKNKVKVLKRAMEKQDKPAHERENLTPDEQDVYKKYTGSVAGLATVQAISWRLEGVEQTGVFVGNTKPVEKGLLERKMVVLRGTQRMLEMVASYVIRKCYQKRRHYQDFKRFGLAATNAIEPDPFPPFFIAMDEAHRFANNSPIDTPTKKILREVAQEARKYGVNLVLGTQRPSVVDSTIASQLNTKVIFRTQMESDMRMIKTETNLTNEEVFVLPKLKTGNAYVSSAVLTKTYYIQFRETLSESPHQDNPFDELSEYDKVDKVLQSLIISMLPINSLSLNAKLLSINTQLGRVVQIEEMKKTLDYLEKAGLILKQELAGTVKYISA